MSTKFSAHPDLAVEQLQRAEVTARQNSNKSHTNHRRHKSAGATTNLNGSRQTTPTKSLSSAAYKSATASKYASPTTANASNSGGFPRLTPVRTPTHNVDVVVDNKFAYNANASSNAAATTDGGIDIDAMVLAYIDDIDLNSAYDGDDDVYIQNPKTSRSHKTKDCVDCAPPTSTLRWSATGGSAAGAGVTATTSQDYSTAGVDEIDNVHHRFSRTAYDCNSRQPPQQLQHNLSDDYFIADTRASSTSSPIHAISDGCVSGLSSALSTPSASTVSSPLSTPTRLAPHFPQPQRHSNCCQKAASDCGGGGGCGNTSDTDKPCNHLHHHSDPHLHHHHHHHHHQHRNHNHQTMASSMSLKSTSKAATAAALAAATASSSTSTSSSASSGCKKSQKFDPRLLGPSRYRQLLPVVLCILSFAIVFSILIVYMDTTEIRHKQFRLNMSRDYEFFGVAQDDPTLIAFLREIHMRKYPMHFLKNAPLDDTSASLTTTSLSSTAATSSASVTTATHFNFSRHYEGLTPEMAHYVADLVGGKEHGSVIQSLPGAMGHLMTAPWLASTLNWVGLLVEPEPRRFFTLRKQNAQRPGLQVVHACISPSPYPKEVTIHNEESEVRINSLLDEETSWFNSRVKCFPLYSLMLACNRVEYDLLSLGVHGHELEILQTLPFDRVQIEVISIHLSEDIARGYVDALTQFLARKSYKLQKTFGRNYFYQRNKTTSRTRKKDILLLKTP